MTARKWSTPAGRREAVRLAVAVNATMQGVTSTWRPPGGLSGRRPELELKRWRDTRDDLARVRERLDRLDRLAFAAIRELEEADRLELIAEARAAINTHDARERRRGITPYPANTATIHALAIGSALASSD